jgi:hypothetical protein
MGKDDWHVEFILKIRELCIHLMLETREGEERAKQ